MSGLMFSPDLALAVVDGQKTQTRRPLSDKPGSPWWRDECKLVPGMNRAVVPGRGRHQIARVRIEAVERTRWSLTTEADAKAEGFLANEVATALEWFFHRIRAMYGNDYDLDQECWKIEFTKTAHIPDRVNQVRQMVREAPPGDDLVLAGRL